MEEDKLSHVQVLATSKLVAVCQLQHCRIVFVPHVDRRTGSLGVMGFLIPDDIYINPPSAPAAEPPAVLSI